MRKFLTKALSLALALLFAPGSVPAMAAEGVFDGGVLFVNELE